MAYQFLGIAKSRIVIGRQLFLDAPQISKELFPVAVLFDPEGGPKTRDGGKRGWVFACPLMRLQRFTPEEIPQPTWNEAHAALIDTHLKIDNNELTVEMLPTTNQVMEASGLKIALPQNEDTFLNRTIESLTRPVRTRLQKAGLLKPKQ